MIFLYPLVAVGILCSLVVVIILGVGPSKSEKEAEKLQRGSKSRTTFRDRFAKSFRSSKKKKHGRLQNTEDKDMGGYDDLVPPPSTRNGRVHEEPFAASASGYGTEAAVPTPAPIQGLRASDRRSGFYDRGASPSSVYVDVDKPKLIQGRDFLQRYQEMASIDPTGFHKEFSTLVTQDISRCRVANMEQNKPKNRFKNILPYDDSRVRLSDNRNGSDYINASYIKGLLNGKEKENMYIATQGPLDHTVSDYWQMIWECKSSVIVMLTNPIEKKKIKCATYWPEVGQTKNVRIMYLRNVEEAVEPFYVRRRIEMDMGGARRLVTQFQFTSWDDKETLETAMPIWQVLDEIGQTIQQSGFTGPIVVNCSAGVGRTGTFIALAHLRAMLHHKNEVDVYNVVSDMRNSRMNMVQVESQYRFIYESLVIWKALRRTSFLVKSFKHDMKNWWRDVKNAQRSRAEKEFKLLEFICPVKKHSVTQAGNLRENWGKNRDADNIPEDVHRPLLMTTPPYDADANNYINASYHHSFQKKHAFIATQTPLQATLGAFWSMILDYKAASIIMFQDSEREVPKYWPDERYQQDYGPFIVGCGSRKQLQANIIQRDLSISTARAGGRNIRQFVINAVQRPDDLSQSITAVVNYVQEWQRETGNGPIVVHCKDGIGLSGCFMAIYSAIDRLNAQHMIDVFTTVRRIRQTRPRVVDTLERYMMVYEALNVYLVHTEQSYSNFNDL